MESERRLSGSVRALSREKPPACLRPGCSQSGWGPSRPPALRAEGLRALPTSGRPGSVCRPRCHFNAWGKRLQKKAPSQEFLRSAPSPHSVPAKLCNVVVFTDLMCF